MGERLPLRVEHSDRELIRLVGPALLVRGACTLEAIGKLADLQRRAEPGVLLRVLLEHMVVFAWLAADPTAERFGLWMKYDSKRRLAMHRDMPDGMPDLLDPHMHALFDGIAGTVEGEFPNLRTCAQQADDHWRTRLAGVLHPAYDWGSHGHRCLRLSALISGSQVSLITPENGRCQRPLRRRSRR